MREFSFRDYLREKEWGAFYNVGLTLRGIADLGVCRVLRDVDEIRMSLDRGNHFRNIFVARTFGNNPDGVNFLGAKAYIGQTQEQSHVAAGGLEKYGGNILKYPLYTKLVISVIGDQSNIKAFSRSLVVARETKGNPSLSANDFSLFVVGLALGSPDISAHLASTFIVNKLEVSSPCIISCCDVSTVYVGRVENGQKVSVCLKSPYTIVFADDPKKIEIIPEDWWSSPDRQVFPLSNVEDPRKHPAYLRTIKHRNLEFPVLAINNGKEKAVAVFGQIDGKWYLIDGRTLQEDGDKFTLNGLEGLSNRLLAKTGGLFFEPDKLKP